MSKQGICEMCGRNGIIHIHHKDGNHKNDIQNNKMSVCPRCHSVAHIDENIIRTGRPGSKPLVERTFEPFPKLPWEEVRKQYNTCFPRAEFT